MPARAIQRKHELGDEALAVRVLRGERLQLADDTLVVTECELRIETQLVRSKAKLLQAFGLDTARGGERDVGQRRPPPHAERGSRQLDDVGVVVQRGGQCRSLLELGEAPCVQCRIAELDGIAGAASHERGTVPVEDLAEPGDVRLERVRRGPRRIVAPDLLDEPPDRHDLAGAEQEH